MGRVLAIASILAAAGCDGNDIPVTGGFLETIVDGSVRHGQGIEATDVDGDGATDIVVALSLTDAVHVYLNVDSAGEWEPISISGAGAIVALDTVTLDIDGDGDRDVAAVGLSQRRNFGTAPGELTWYENPGDARGVWTTHPIHGPTDTSTRTGVWGGASLDAGDLDGDGIEDLIVGSRNANDDRGVIFGNEVTWYKGEGNGAFTGPLSIDANLLDVNAVRVTDLDGDGRLDVLAGADQGQQVALYHNEDGGDGPRFVKYTLWDDGAVHGLDVADLDGDGQDELVIGSYSMTSSVSVSVLKRPAVLSDPWPRTEIATGFGLAAAESPKVQVDDFDGDGNLDILASAQGGGDLRVYRGMDDGTFQHCDVRGGYVGLNGLARADFDGDGRIDILTSSFEFGSRDRIAWWRNVGFPDQQTCR